jgi:hypothetical protein
MHPPETSSKTPFACVNLCDESEIFKEKETARPILAYRIVSFEGGLLKKAPVSPNIIIFPNVTVKYFITKASEPHPLFDR